MRYFTSDQHFAHANIIGYCGRPYATVTEMDRDIIDRWNATVSAADEVYVLGDFALTSLHRIAEIVGCLKGHAKHLIMGNHDRHKAPHYLKAGFTSAHKSEILTSRVRLDGEIVPLYLQHRPVSQEVVNGHWTLCGHVHQNWTIRRHVKCLNVGVDVHDFRPISEARVIELIEASHPFSGTDD